jgi:hypothetical protein
MVLQGMQTRSGTARAVERVAMHFNEDNKENPRMSVYEWSQIQTAGGPTKHRG